MNADLIKSILSLVAASIPLLILLVAFFRTRMERTTKQIDSPLLKILLIKRYPISEKDWSKEKSKSQSLQTIFSLLYLAYIILSNFILHNQEYILLILATIYLLTAYIGIIFGRFSYKNRLESADQARYFLFT